MKKLPKFLEIETTAQVLIYLWTYCVSLKCKLVSVAQGYFSLSATQDRVNQSKKITRDRNLTTDTGGIIDWSDLTIIGGIVWHFTDRETLTECNDRDTAVLFA